RCSETPTSPCPGPASPPLYPWARPPETGHDDAAAVRGAGGAGATSAAPGVQGHARGHRRRRRGLAGRPDARRPRDRAARPTLRALPCRGSHAPLLQVRHRAPRPGSLARRHETLCFLQAYADGPEVLERVGRALAEFPQRVMRLGPAARKRLHDAGIANATLDYPFGFPMARWLTSRFPRDCEV